MITAGAMIGKPTDNDISCPALDNKYGQIKTAFLLLHIESPMEINVERLGQ